MQAIPRMDSTRLFAAQTVEVPEAEIGQIVSLGRWMTVLGIVRVSCAAAVLIKALIDMSRGRGEIFSSTGASPLASPPILLICMVWPLAVALLVSQTGQRSFLRLASLTFFLLAAAGVVSLSADWSRSDRALIAVGSFRVSRINPGLTGLILLTLGLAQLLAEFFVAGRGAWILMRPRSEVSGSSQPRSSAIPGEIPRWQRALLSGGWILSLLVLIPIVRLPAIPKLNDLLDRHPLLRDLLLMNDRPGNPRRVGKRQPGMISSARDREIQGLIFQATTAWSEKRFEDARLAYTKAVEFYRSAEGDDNPQRLSNQAMIENNLAWLLVTRPDPRPDDPQEAVAYAQRSLAISPSDGYYWNTLGAAHYRAKNWQSAKDALLRSMELRGDGDGYDWILLALIHAQTGRKDRALEWYEKAARWRSDFRPWDHELYRFQAEAAEILDLPKPSDPIQPHSFRSREESGHATFKGRSLPMGSPFGEPKESFRGMRRPGAEGGDLRRSPVK